LLVSETSEVGQGDTSPCRETTQKPAHKLFPFGKNHSDAFPTLPSADGGAGKDSALIHNGMSIKPCEGPAAANCLTIKKHTFTLADYDALPNEKVQTIINRSLLFGSPLVGKPERKGVINFYKMKKQILFLTMITLAFIFAGTSKSYGQVGAASPYVMVPDAVPSCITARTLSGCSSDELHPVQGDPYTYEVTTTDPADLVRWFVLDNTAMEAGATDSIVASTVGILAAGNTYIDPADNSGSYVISYGVGTYDTRTAGNTQIEITWKYFDGVANEVLLVAYVEGADGCTNNIAVYRIIPMPAFTIDVASIAQDGTVAWDTAAVANSECVSPIESAFYNGNSTTPDGTLTVDYGENWVYFLINGANYTDSWMPSIQLTYDQTVPAGVEAQWTYLSDAQGTNWFDFSGGDLAGGTWTSAEPVIAGANYASHGNTSNVGDLTLPATGGECIIVRVRLDWGTGVEHDLADGTLTLAANGTSYDGDDTSGSFYDNAAFDDLHYADCSDQSFEDTVNYIITPRPQVEEGTPTQEIKTGQATN